MSRTFWPSSVRPPRSRPPIIPPWCLKRSHENLDLKVKLLSRIISHNSRDAWFFTNTSSIPISELNAKANLNGRLIGFHFYNPPAVQKLVELISAESTLPDLADFARQFAKKLRKTVVPSHDVAGFIGNGHFMRDALYAVAEVERLAEDFGLVERDLHGE